MEYRYAERMKNLRASEVRELLKVTENKDIISFGGGLPAPELFPIEEIKKVSAIVLEESGTKALQYATTEGYAPLRKWIAERMNTTLGTNLDADNILLTNGSQQGLDLTGKVFLDKGDVVLCESPTYLSAIGAFRAYECEFVEVETDDDGMKPDDLEACIQQNSNAKLIYVVPNFQNPTGRSWSLERRKALVEIAQKHGLLIVEDNPYGELRFEGEHLPSVKSLDTTGGVMHLGTFSKTFCPGYRIGWVAGEHSVIEKYVLAKQGTDLQCNTLAQMEIAKYLELYDIDEHIEKIKQVYKRRRNIAIETIEREFPEGVNFTRPQGGLFLWIELPEHMNAREILALCIQQGVTFVPGGAFYPNGGHENTMRINFSNMPEERIVKGLKIIAQTLK